jgi:signal transduction histidine kinase
MIRVLDPDLGAVKVDSGRMEQVILNLVVNARDATPGGGTIVLETQNAELGDVAMALHPEIMPGRYVMLAVTDSGTGMEEHIRALTDVIMPRKNGRELAEEVVRERPGLKIVFMSG